MYLIFKRIFDIGLSAFVGISLLPIFIPIIVLLFLTGEGKVFYRQIRMGKDYSPFGILKFATMIKDSLNVGNKTITIKNDARILPLGKLLRSTKINELPQIWNVLVGNMSIVGPRPLLINSFYKYTEPVQEIISKLQPGITGLGSVVFRDEEKLISLVRELGGEPLGFYRFYVYPYKGELESYYGNHQSFITDSKIIFLTAWYILFKNSNLVYTFFKDLPEKPITLTLEGIRSLDMSKVKEIEV